MPIIRPYRASDAAAIAEIFHRAVHEIASAHYTPAQCAAWSPAPAPAETWARHASDGRLVLVAAPPQGHPTGFIELETNGHIDCFYCHPDVAGTGTGHALYTAMEGQARSQGLTRLFVEASEPAKRFFTKVGFSVLHRRDIERRGVKLYNFAMEKDLCELRPPERRGCPRRGWQDFW
jgi:putative acetyltransferase